MLSVIEREREKKLGNKSWHFTFPGIAFLYIPQPEHVESCAQKVMRYNRAPLYNNSVYTAERDFIFYFYSVYNIAVTKSQLSEDLRIT